MKITVFKSRKLQVSEYEPYTFGFGLEQEVDGEVHTHKEFMENIVDEWIDKETTKWEKYKKFGIEKHPVKKPEPKKEEPEKPLIVSINGEDMGVPF